MGYYEQERGVGLLVYFPAQGMICVQEKVGHPISELNGRLCLWGGGVDEGESPKEAIHREIKEEFSPEIEEILIQHLDTSPEVFEVEYPNPTNQHKIIRNTNWVIRIGGWDYFELSHLLRLRENVYEGRPRIMRIANLLEDHYKFFPGHREFMLEVLRPSR